MTYLVPILLVLQVTTGKVLKPPGGGTSSLFASAEDLEKPRVSPAESTVTASNGSVINGTEVLNGKSGNNITAVNVAGENVTGNNIIENITENPSVPSLDKSSAVLETISIPSADISAEIRSLSAQIQKRQRTRGGFEDLIKYSVEVEKRKDAEADNEEEDDGRMGEG
ncbi:hypothetical protein Phum_PHUM491830 [Pediculus humanus corporis]|uniref:Uncharacterized protein n=1 Tax=Pediculus humanus subsp. corporis TaxID=121224 RepID=E0VWW8_PEDHC|nr:uncharacterized protein Phum_PHUM491830 [Pediculus humanus corporis]EEB17874.1 hypothetical protein Phum_PHUM491830 [Pediculus humanus corporis]